MPSMQRRSYLRESKNERSERRFRNRTRACLRVLLFSIAVDDMSISCGWTNQVNVQDAQRADLSRSLLVPPLSSIAGQNVGS